MRCTTHFCHRFLADTSSYNKILQQFSQKLCIPCALFPIASHLYENRYMFFVIAYLLYKPADKLLRI